MIDKVWRIFRMIHRRLWLLVHGIILTKVHWAWQTLKCKMRYFFWVRTVIYIKLVLNGPKKLFMNSNPCTEEYKLYRSNEMNASFVYKRLTRMRRAQQPISFHRKQTTHIMTLKAQQTLQQSIFSNVVSALETNTVWCFMWIVYQQTMHTEYQNLFPFV